MKQISLATLTFESARKVLPPSKWLSLNSANKPVGHSTLTYLLPYVEEQALADKWDMKNTWSWPDPAKAPYDNANLKETPIAIFRGPSAPPERSSGTGGAASNNPAAIDYRVCDAFAAVTSKGGTKYALDEEIDAGKVKKRPNKDEGYWSVLYNEGGNSNGPKAYQNEYAKLKYTTDGLSQTMMWFETGGAPVKYKDGHLDTTNPNASETQGGDTWADFANWYVIHNRCGDSFFNCNNNEEIYSFHVGGAYFGFGDGAVHFISTDINPDVFVSLFTRDGSDVINDVQF
jgi:hypothetical protein